MTPDPRVCPLCSAPHLEDEPCYDDADAAWTPTCEPPPRESRRVDETPAPASERAP